MTRRSSADTGFTMIELAVALFLIALLFGSIAMPLQTRVEIRKAEETAHILHQARTALLGYAAANGYLPCPADESSAGQEAPGTNHETGYCPTYFGFLPAAALGMDVPESRGYAVDAWGGSANRTRYAVSSYSVGSVANAMTRVNGMRSAGVARLSDPALSLFHVCDSGSGVSPGSTCGKAVTLVSSTPAVIWSSGANAASGGASVHEAQNPHASGGSADRLFVSRARSNASGAEFDDQVTWIPMSVLLHRLLAAGQVP
jgi:prepilin-type N-terminal cleavage/methylation domain-containing protein